LRLFEGIYWCSAKRNNISLLTWLILFKTSTTSYKMITFEMESKTNEMTRLVCRFFVFFKMPKIDYEKQQQQWFLLLAFPMVVFFYSGNISFFLFLFFFGSEEKKEQELLLQKYINFGHHKNSLCCSFWWRGMGKKVCHSLPIQLSIQITYTSMTIIHSTRGKVEFQFFCRTLGNIGNLWLIVKSRFYSNLGWPKKSFFEVLKFKT